MGMTASFYFYHLAFISVVSRPVFGSSLAVAQWFYTNAELASLIPVVLVVGGFIILTLTYVSWRKYKGEKEKRNNRKNRDKIVDGDDISD